MVTELQVVDFPRRRDESATFTARPLGDDRIPPRVRVSWYHATEVPQIGDVWRLEVRLRRPRGTSNPGVFDFETWLFRHRIGATGYVVDGPRNRRLRTNAGGGVSRLRQHVVERLAAAIGAAETAAVASAISVGATHGISAEQWQRYSQSGTSHLMAISGLHVGLAATSAWFLAAAILAVLRAGGNHLRVAWVAAIAVAAGFACISGFAVPAQRATLMLLILVSATLRARQPGPVAMLAAACLIVTALDPLTTLAAGFQLSFAAVLLLIWFAQRRRLASRPSGVTGFCIGAMQLLAVQVFLFFGLTPLTVSHFGRISFVAPAINFVAVPLFSAVTVPFVLAGLLLDGPLGAAGDAALRVAGVSIELLHRLIGRALTFPLATATIATSAATVPLCLVVVFAWAALPRGWPGRHVALLATLALVSGRVEGPPQNCADVRMLDVGQGLAVVVRTGRRTMLYDTAAAYPGGSDMATRVVLPYLSAQGIRKIDRLVVSHSDTDHSGGTASVLAGIHVAGVIAGEPGRLAGAEACRRGRAWRWDGVAFRVLHPARGGQETGNDASCVILVEAGDARLLLTGDIESGVERLLVARGLAGPVDAVVIPHHGSGTSSTAEFVQALSAEAALVSAGHRNRWGLPRVEVLERWRDAGAAVFATPQDGAIGFRLCDRGGIANLSRNRVQSRRLWHEPPPR